MNTCGGSIISSLTVNVVATGLNEPGKDKAILVFPNPVKGMVHLVSDRMVNCDVNVTNSQGSTVITLHNVNLTRKYKLDVSSLQPGNYFIIVTSADTREVVKMTVQ